MSHLPMRASTGWRLSAWLRMHVYTSRRALFWTLQLGGWIAYDLSKLLAFPVTLRDSAWMAVQGIALTCLLRWMYHSLERRAPPLPVILVVAVVSSLVMAKLSLEISIFASIQGWMLTAPGTATWLRGWQAFLHQFLLMMTWSGLYLGIRYAMDLHLEKERLRAALADAQQARAQMLRYQLNPHFLFNALTSLRASIDEDPRRAQRMINDLSGFLRYSLLGGTADEVTLEREFQAIGHYLAIQKVRFEERIDYELQLDPGLPELRLPAFLIQPLVENAVKYGMRTSEGGATIRVRGTRHGDGCELEVANTGHWVEDAGAGMDLDRSGIGLCNLRQRLAEHFPGRHRFGIESSDGWVRARLVLDGR